MPGHLFVVRLPDADGEPVDVHGLERLRSAERSRAAARRARHRRASDPVLAGREGVLLGQCGVGRIYAYNKWIDMPDNRAETPYVFESEILSPFASLQPGETYTWQYEWAACRIGGDFPVLDCTDTGVVCEPFVARFDRGKLLLSGRFGVFHRATAGLVFRDGDGKLLSRSKNLWPVTPSKPFVLPSESKVASPPAGAAAVELVIHDESERELGRLACAELSAR